MICFEKYLTRKNIDIWPDSNFSILLSINLYGVQYSLPKRKMDKKSWFQKGITNRKRVTGRKTETTYNKMEDS